MRVILAALLLDWLFGDPPNRLHPVAWMGRLIGSLRNRTPERHKFAYGIGIAWGGAAVVYILVRLVEKLPLGWMWGTLLLKLTFSLRGLDRAAGAVETDLARHDVPEARRLLSWHLVSRDTTQLNASQVSAAAIESVAENTSDGVIAPLFYYALGGLPAAYAYRYIQTCDSMLGYRDAEREWLGKASARTDDLLNWIPSRLTAVCFVLASALTGDDPRTAYTIWRRDGDKTASPNAGQPMSAAAGALGVELEKVDHYRLGAGLKAPTPVDIARSRRLMKTATLLFIISLMLLRKRK